MTTTETEKELREMVDIGYLTKEQEQALIAAADIVAKYDNLATCFKDRSYQQVADDNAELRVKVSKYESALGVGGQSYAELAAKVATLEEARDEWIAGYHSLRQKMDTLAAENRELKMALLLATRLIEIRDSWCQASDSDMAVERSCGDFELKERLTKLGL